ncbi:MAG: hypothetical protein FJW38_04580 [Acidobacteria bacterium]|nr:hypothetical protein [Acidobacteriota bacterium]
MEEARRLLDDLAKADPENGRLAENAACVRYMLAEDAIVRERWAAALEHVQAAEAKLSALARKDPRDNDRARMLLECYVIYPRILLKLGKTDDARKLAGTIAAYATSRKFASSNSPRVRTLVVRALMSAGETFGGEKEREYLMRAETEMKRIEADGISGPHVKPAWDDLRAALKRR